MEELGAGDRRARRARGPACRWRPGSTSSPTASVRWANPEPCCCARWPTATSGRRACSCARGRRRRRSRIGRVAQPITGPYTLAHRDPPRPQRDAAHGVHARVRAHLAAELRALAAAGCPMALIEEPDAVLIGGYPADHTNEIERELFAATQERLLADPSGLHAMLVVDRRLGVGGRSGRDPRRAVPVLPVRPDHRSGQLVSHPRGAGRSGRGLRGAAAREPRRPAARARLGGALRGVVQRARARARRPDQRRPRSRAWTPPRSPGPPPRSPRRAASPSCHPIRRSPRAWTRARSASPPTAHPASAATRPPPGG